MRALSFKGFLKEYLRSLSGQHSLSLPRLTSLATGQKRLLEPLVLWAVVTGKEDAVSKLLAEKPRLVAELRELAAVSRSGKLEDALCDGDSAVRPEYKKVWSSYVVRRDAHLRDDRLKLEARRRVLALEATRHVSRYRMAKDLCLNQGNLFAFLNQGNPNKLSLDRAYALVSYLESAGEASAPIESHNART